MTCTHTVGKRRQRGVSLIELMIGLVVGTVILFGIIETMLVSKSASQTQQSMSAIAENARLAFEFINRDLRMAGYDWSVTGEDFNLVDKDGNPVLDDDGNAKIISGASYVGFDNGATPKLTAYYKNADGHDIQIEYSFEGDGSGNTAIKYKNTDVTGENAETLIDGVEGIDVEFGIWKQDVSSGTPVSSITYEDSVGALSETRLVVAIRITLSFQDPTSENRELLLGDDLRTISSTIALRNPIIAAKRKINEDS